MKKLQLFTLVALLSSATYFNQTFALWPFKNNDETQTNIFVNADQTKKNSDENKTDNKKTTVIRGQQICSGGNGTQTNIYHDAKEGTTTTVTHINGSTITVNGLRFECDGVISITNGEVRCNGIIIHPANQTPTDKHEAKTFFRRLFKK